jgi:dihydrofolate reductase
MSAQTTPVSLDGFIEGPDGKFDWAFPDLELHQYFNDLERETGAHLYGRRLYEVMSYWRTTDTNPASTPVEIEYAHLWQQVPTIVVGSGKSFFPALDEPINLRLVETRTFTSGVVYLRYQGAQAGDWEIGISEQSDDQ